MEVHYITFLGDDYKNVENVGVGMPKRINEKWVNPMDANDKRDCIELTCRFYKMTEDEINAKSLK